MPTLIVRAEPDAPPADAVEPHSFWTRPLVQDVLPFCSSLALHLGVVLVGILMYKAAVIIVTDTSTPLVIPGPTDISTVEVGAPPAFDAGITETDTKSSLKPLQELVPEADPKSKGLSDRASAILAQHEGGGSSDDTDGAIALGLQKEFGRGKAGLGGGEGNGIGNGTDGGPGLAAFGPRQVGTGTGPFIGYAKKVLFLCDSSGSMTSKFDALRQELRKAIDRLRADQEFDVIFFSEDQYLALDIGLLYALPENKRRAYEFLDRVTPHGSSDPLPGLRAAFDAKPELIFMLTDGDFPNNDATLDGLRKFRGNKPVKVNTIAFMDRGESYEKLLADIARETGGSFRFVSEQDLSGDK